LYCDAVKDFLDFVSLRNDIVDVAILLWNSNKFETIIYNLSLSAVIITFCYTIPEIIS